MRRGVILFAMKSLKIGTRSVHVGSLSEISQDTCASVSIVTMLN